MELGHEKMAKHLETIITKQGRILEAKHNYEELKRQFDCYLGTQLKELEIEKREALLKQQGLRMETKDFMLCEQESRKEISKWKTLSPEETISTFAKRFCWAETDDEDWEPMTDIQVDRQMEEEFEQELECLERQEKERERKEVRQMRLNSH